MWSKVMLDGSSLVRKMQAFEPTMFHAGLGVCKIYPPLPLDIFNLAKKHATNYE